jgi:hypothetical protein
MIAALSAEARVGRSVALTAVGNNKAKSLLSLASSKVQRRGGLAARHLSCPRLLGRVEGSEG